jgi:hypothetical protein
MKNSPILILCSHSSLMRLSLSAEDAKSLLAWYHIRDKLLGENRVEQDVKKALQLAAVCEHADAVWLTNLFAGRGVNTWQEARQTFLDSEDQDARALCFGALGHQKVLESVLFHSFSQHISQKRIDMNNLRRSAELGFAFAQAKLARLRNGRETFEWAERASVAGEREGVCDFFFCFLIKNRLFLFGILLQNGRRSEF